MLEGCYTQFVTEHGLTAPVFFHIGTKQGDPISPLIFLLFMLPLQWKLKSLPDKFSVICAINHLCYADDLMTLALTESGIKTLFNTVVKYSTLTDFTINVSKSAYAYINVNPSWTPKVNGVCLEILGDKKSYKYLGIPINLNLLWGEVLKQEGLKFKKKSRPNYVQKVHWFNSSS